MRVLKIFILFLLGVSAVFAQFGQNRVQYKDYDWRFIQTKHFDIYFSKDGDKIAEFTAKAAEDALASVQGYLDYKINSRISLIVYNSHNDFQETNTTDSYIGQGTGGFTEPFKNRVVFPFEGSFEKFRHVIHHELVHAVMRDMLYGGTVQNIIAKNISLQLPLWYHEGMAEYLSSQWETNSDMFLRDAVINEYLPDVNGLGGYFAYRGGQSLFYYIAETYGKEKIGELLNKIQGLGNVEEGVKSSIGLTLEELNDRWKKSLKKEYWPEIAEREDPEDYAKRLTDNKKEGGFYNTSPAISPQGDKIVFISDRDIYLDVYVMDAFDGKVIDKIISSGKTNDFEELNVLFPSLTWAPDNNRVALSKKSAGYDRVYIHNVEEDEGEELPFKLDGVESVAWSPDGDKIAFSGATAKQSDIYVYSFKNKNLVNLTNDIFSDNDPRWSDDSETIFFASDRGKYLTADDAPADFMIADHKYKQLDLYSIEMGNRKVERITNWELSTEKSPVISPDGKELLFVSDYNGINNIYKKRLYLTENDTVKTIADLPAVPLTNSLNGIAQLSASKDRKKLVFSTLFKGGYNIFLMNNPFEAKPVAEKLEFTNFMAELVEKGKEDELNKQTDDVFSDYDESLTSLDNYSFSETAIPVVKKVEPENNDTLTTTGMSIYTGQYEDTATDTARVKDYSNYVFGKVVSKKDSSNQINRDSLFASTLDDNGNFLVNKYKINFSPDLVYANAGYSTYYGLLGTTVLSFSDMLGNHRIIGLTSMQVDLKNSDYGLAYYYLPKRINYGIEAFHTARFVYLINKDSRDLYRFRNYGAVVSASLPFSRFYRLDMSMSVLNISSENLDNIFVPNEQITYFVPSIKFVKDNTMYGYTAPIEGSRYYISLFGNPGFNNSSQSFFSVSFDYRKYWRFFYDNSMAIRFSGGYSGGANPQRFFLGGTENWVNRQFATGEIPLDDPSDFAFLSPALPMRGYDYAEKIGTKYSLMNLELRMPVIRALLTGPLPLFFRNIIGVAFIDAGAAWDDNKSLQLIDATASGTATTRDLLLGTGYGLRMNFIFLWRMDVAWSYDLREFSGPKYYFSLGLDF